SLVYGNGRYGIELSGVSGARVEANEAYGNQYGIVVSGGSAQTIIGNTDVSLGRGNLVHDNIAGGISASSNVLVAGNTVWGHAGVNDYGISVSSNASVWDNVVYGNYV